MTTTTEQMGPITKAWRDYVWLTWGKDPETVNQFGNAILLNLQRQAFFAGFRAGVAAIEADHE